MNILVLGNFVLLKEEQPPWLENKADGLESEDASAEEPIAQLDPLVKELKTLFQTTFLPLAKALRRRNEIMVKTEYRQVPTMWTKFEGPSTGKALFEFPVAMSSPRFDPARFVDALLLFWSPGPASELLRPLLLRLVQLGQRFPAQGEMEEEVSESIYVMF